jgi:hypothetical protein
MSRVGEFIQKKISVSQCAAKSDAVDTEGNNKRPKAPGNRDGLIFSTRDKLVAIRL